MWQSAYLEGRVLGADPLELIRILYQHALESVRSARVHLAAGDIAARSRACSHAIEAVAQLRGALDHSAGGTISRSLEELYHYISQLLFEANMNQTDGPLAESESLLAVLADAWKPQAEEASAKPQQMPPLPAIGGAYRQNTDGTATHNWCG